MCRHERGSPGCDRVGTVAAACAGSGFSPGNRVWSSSLGHAGRQGAYAEYAVVPSDRLYPLPDSAVAAEATAAFHSAATAYIGLHHRARARAGQTVLVGGAAGGIGSALVRFASEAGLRVIGFAISLATATELADAAQAINRDLASGGFTTKPADIMPLDKASEAHALIESRQSVRAIIQIGGQP
jgi:NADPH:quinone reductase-like Zn-dependent oxidoreductase